MPFYTSYLEAILNFVRDSEYGLVISVAAFCISACLLCSICSKCCRDKEKIVSSESFKWPNSKSFLKKTSPINPPKLIVPKYEDPLRIDHLPEGGERHWRLLYQPNGERNEVQQHMYLVFRNGDVSGVGYEGIRKLCKIKGKYKYNIASNQIVLVADCFFANERDHVLLHGTGNGTALVGNCYIHEIDPFSTTSGVPMLRVLFGDRFKGSFLLEMESGMGDIRIRHMLHTRRVQQYAKDLYPDKSMPMPNSPLNRLGGEDVEQFCTKNGHSSSRRSSRHPLYDPLELTNESTETRNTRRAGRKIRHRSWTGPFSSSRALIGKLFRRGKNDNTEYPVEEFSAVQPEWVRSASGSRPDSPQRSLSPSGRSGRRERRIMASGLQGLKGINELNYLEVDAIPGRSGPARV